MLTFTINIPQVLVYMPYMDPTGLVVTTINWDINSNYCGYRLGPGYELMIRIWLEFPLASSDHDFSSATWWESPLLRDVDLTAEAGNFWGLEPHPKKSESCSDLVHNHWWKVFICPNWTYLRNMDWIWTIKHGLLIWLIFTDYWFTKNKVWNIDIH